MRFTYARRTQEHKGTDRLVGVFQSHPVALYGLHHFVYSLILTDDFALQFSSHGQQFVAFGLSNTLHGHAGHHGYHLGYFLFVDNLAVLLHLFLPVVFGRLQREL